VKTRSRVVRTVATAVVAATSLLAFHPSASAQSSNADPDNLGFDVKVTAGQPLGYLNKFATHDADNTAGPVTVTGSVVITGQFKQRTELMIEAITGNTNAFGGIGFTPSGVSYPLTGAGTWIDIQPSVVVEAYNPEAPQNSIVTIPYTATVPADARSGLNLAGIAFWVDAKSARPLPEINEDEIGLTQEWVVRRVVGVEFITPVIGATIANPDVPDATVEREPQLVITGLKAGLSAAGLNLQFGIDNRGTDYSMRGAQGRVTVSQGDFSNDFLLDETVPGTSILYASEWISDAEPGIFDATVNLRYDDGREASWTGTFEVGDQLVKEARKRAALPTEFGDSSRWWLWVGLVVAIIAIGLAVRFWVFRGDDGDEYDEWGEPWYPSDSDEATVVDDAQEDDDGGDDDPPPSIPRPRKSRFGVDLEPVNSESEG